MEVLNQLLGGLSQKVKALYFVLWNKIFLKQFTSYDDALKYFGAQESYRSLPDGGIVVSGYWLREVDAKKGRIVSIVMKMEEDGPLRLELILKRNPIVCVCRRRSTLIHSNRYHLTVVKDGRRFNNIEIIR